MRMHSLILITTVAFGVATPLGAQQHQHAAAAPQNHDMAAMMCGGGMAAMMQMHGTGMAGMRMDGMKPGMRMDSTKPGMHMDSMKPGMHMDSTKPGMANMMSGMAMMMGPPGPAMILHQKAKLGLSAAQVGRLEALQKQAQPDCAHHMQLAMTSHMAASQLLDAATPDFSAFEARLKEATTHMVEGHVVMAKAAIAARDVLTAAQRQTLENQMGMMHKMP